MRRSGPAKWWWALPAIVAIGLLGLLAACGDDENADGSATTGDRTLTVYSGRDEELVAPIFERFTEETGIELEVRYAGTTDLALLLEEEGDRSPADVFFSQSPGATAFLAERDLLAPMDDEILDVVDERVVSDDGLWVGVSGRQRVLVYNRDQVEASELPASVFDLVEPRYEGRVAVPPGNGSFQDFVTALRVFEGDERAEEFLSGLAANDAQVYENNSSIVEAVGRGEVDMGLVNHYYNFRAQAEDPDVASVNHVFPGGDLGSIVLAASVSIPAASDQPEVASELVAFLLGEEAQTYFAQETFEYPLRPGVAAAGDLPPLETPETDLGRLADLEQTARIIAASGLE